MMTQMEINEDNPTTTRVTVRDGDMTTSFVMRDDELKAMLIQGLHLLKDVPAMEIQSITYSNGGRQYVVNTEL